MTTNSDQNLAVQLFSQLSEYISRRDFSEMSAQFTFALEASGVTDWRAIGALIPRVCDDFKSLIRFLTYSDSLGPQRAAALAVIESYWKYVFSKNLKEDEGPVLAFRALGNEARWRILKTIERRPRISSELSRELKL